MVERNTRMQFQRNGKYDKEEVQDRVVELRSKGRNWEEITKIVKEEIDEPLMSRAKTKDIYNTAIARTITVEKKAGKKLKDYTKELDKMYGKSISVLEGYIHAAEQISNELLKMIDRGDIKAVQAYGIILKTAPQMKAITSEIRDFMKLQQDQQEKIKVEQKSLVWSETQMLDYMDIYLNKLKKEGWTILPPNTVTDTQLNTRRLK